jgi:hypothetical protein
VGAFKYALPISAASIFKSFHAAIRKAILTDSRETKVEYIIETGGDL